MFITTKKPILTEQELFDGCLSGNKTAQKAFFDRFSPKMFGVCKRYVKQREDAEDMMIEGLYKALANIAKFKQEGSFEGWVRRIVVNECLMFLRKQSSFNMVVVEMNEQHNAILDDEITIAEQLAGQDILAIMDKLPTGYRTVFNLYVIEGYKHREIADLLNISINTSKSQLILAKEKLKQILVKENIIKQVG